MTGIFSYTMTSAAKICICSKIVKISLILIVITGTASGQMYLSWNFENGSPVNWQSSGNDTVYVDLIYDHEYYSIMGKFCDLLSQHTPYLANIVVPGNSKGTFANGLFNRFGINTAIVELNMEWMENENRHPTSDDWKLIGEKLPDILMEFFGTN